MRREYSTQDSRVPCFFPAALKCSFCYAPAVAAGVPSPLARLRTVPNTSPPHWPPPAPGKGRGRQVSRKEDPEYRAACGTPKASHHNVRRLRNGDTTQGTG